MNDALHTEMQDVKKDLGEMKTQMKEMYQALIGNRMLNDGGLIGRFVRMEEKIDKLEERVEKAEEKSSKLEVYQKILWAFAGITATGVIGYIIQVIFSHK